MSGSVKPIDNVEPHLELDGAFNYNYDHVQEILITDRDIVMFVFGHQMVKSAIKWGNR